MSLFAELKRRNVFRVAIAYILLGWAVLQGADFMLDLVAAPEWVIRVFAIAGLVGFPFALFFAWAYELTPEGIRREHEVDRSQSITVQTGRKLNAVIVGLLVVAVGFLLIDRYFESRLAGSAVPEQAAAPVAEADATAAPAEPGTPSLAVLPFVNMSDDNDYFADGLSEELLNLLAKLPGLKVAGRTSSFRFKGLNEDLRQIGEALGVNHVLEGSVRRSGERLRITAQLIKVDDGFHLWSETYDRRMADIFDIQDDVAAAITQALEVHLVSREERPTENFEAYSHYLQALALQQQFRQDDAIASLEKALELDPQFAEAWALMANLYWLAGGVTLANAEAQLKTFEFSSKALELDPGLLEARAFVETSNPDGYSYAREDAALEALVSAQPGNFNALYALTWNLIQHGYFREALGYADQMMRIEPLAPASHEMRGMALLAAGRREEGLAAWQHCMQLFGEGTALPLAVDSLVRQDYQQAGAWLEQHYRTTGRDPAAVRRTIDQARDPASGTDFIISTVREEMLAGPGEYRRPEAYLWYLAFGLLDEYWAAIEEVQAGRRGWTDADNMQYWGMVFRRSAYVRHPRYLEQVAWNGMMDVWEQRGAPDHCGKQDGRWVCE